MMNSYLPSSPLSFQLAMNINNTSAFQLGLTTGTEGRYGNQIQGIMFTLLALDVYVTIADKYRTSFSKSCSDRCSN